MGVGPTPLPYPTVHVTTLQPSVLSRFGHLFAVPGPQNHSYTGWAVTRLTSTCVRFHNRVGPLQIWTDTVPVVFTWMRLAYSQLYHECAHSCAQNLLWTSSNDVICSSARAYRAAESLVVQRSSLPCTSLTASLNRSLLLGDNHSSNPCPSTHNNKPLRSIRLRIISLKLPCYFSLLRSGPTIGLPCHALPITTPSWKRWPPCSTNWPARSGSSNCPMPHRHHLLLQCRRLLLPPLLLASKLVSEFSSSAEGNIRDALAPLWSFTAPCSGRCISRLPRPLRPNGSTRRRQACNFSIPDHIGPLSTRLFLVPESLRGCFS
jgi:hypothetical protein